MTSPSEVSADHPGAGLFVVATPVGNLADISVRGRHLLATCDHVLAEDTRRTRQLLAHQGIKRRLLSLHGHNENERIPWVLEALAAGSALALVADAGTPGVSDPGAHVVAAVHQAGFRVVPIPGPSALTAALSVAGMTTKGTSVLFVGFLPTKTSARHAVLERIGAFPDVVVFFEAPHRIKATLEALAAADGERQACVCRELTKVHEEIRRGSLGALAAWVGDAARGEFTVVLASKPRPAAAIADVDADVRAAVKKCLAAGVSNRDTAQAVAVCFGVPRRYVYGLCSEGNPVLP